MQQIIKVTQKDRERRHAGAFLQRLGEDPKHWGIHAEQERPDFILTSPTGQRIGLEITELITTDFGKLRKAEHLVLSLIQEVVGDFISSIGVPGAIVSGNNKAIVPPHHLDLKRLRCQLGDHLAQHGVSLKPPNGVIKVALKHDYGAVSRIHRSDKPRVTFMLDWPANSPSYKEVGQPLTEVEQMFLKRIEDKVNRAHGYAKDYPLWLAIRNPCHEQINNFSPACIQEACSINDRTFARIVLFNDPEHILDPCPPPPHYVEITYER